MRDFPALGVSIRAEDLLNPRGIGGCQLSTPPQHPLHSLAARLTLSPNISSVIQNILFILTLLYC